MGIGKGLNVCIEMSKSSTNLLAGKIDEATHKKQTASMMLPTVIESATYRPNGPDDEEAPSLALMAAPAADGNTQPEGEHHPDHGLCTFPKGSSARLAWIISFPIMLPLTFTIPNCHKYPRWY